MKTLTPKELKKFRKLMDLFFNEAREVISFTNILTEDGLLSHFTQKTLKQVLCWRS